MFYQHIVTKNIYELYYTITDYCDRRNAYSLILVEKKESTHLDRVIGFIRDSECRMLVRPVLLFPEMSQS